jgi:hypothetical protein
VVRALLWSHREVAKRVAESSRSALEDIAVWLVNSFIDKLLDIVAYTSAMAWSDVQQKLIEKGLTDPTADDILAVLEDMADRVDFDEALKYAEHAGAVGAAIETILHIGISAAKRFASRDLIQRFTYEKVLEQARKRGMEKVVEYLTRYPKLSRKLIDWLRSKMLSEKL